ncbi:Formyl transferase domain protein OS=Tsukamurella paurometabola (strain ATCC 8368 / DSM / CCUG 35730 / CIP 100753 / JCM 10117 / KCTC 9821 / NBRC 16120 /NCIMB 702349 / NCTC 13040) OX=521096 GN=Tpau_3690 PE=4 SV=1 [Tsukamurella paurometabola]|uniref:Formyl transferase domain protein n=1 Tax=Tsukamurella paurometabola (strain ATCC 8368 / DSM 20162 / CCUG 35730 / CIP 100753 / JCM 10117 / KCTC 9821 / NBRC 16120 / NCIMB 702349 / NCTC 13040) TaxID=521096 RepID=D5UY31_TSUPD|nr:methionyl-tRNA formyltransferase [Tsukamurella paurometabola]ADG80268.1 formyl transferase domain protein [Tsukamurella paurometabola DSM 20162]SUP39075.1 Polymyxin resistance protein PmrI [Tsukamurella paurometabola]
MRVVTFGFQTWGHRTLSAVLDAGHEVTLAVTHPVSNNPYEQMWNDSVEQLATDRGVPVFLAKRPDAGLLEAVTEAQPDIIVANNWRTWLPKSIYSLPRLGTLNIHDSLLPKYAGFSPLIWALINGETHVGVTAHLMDEGLDTGPIIAQESIAVGPADRTVDLFHRTVDLIGPLVARSLRELEAGTAVAVPQDPAAATYFHKRSDDDSCIDWTWPADAIERLIRAQSDPYPNAHTVFRGERLAITAASVSTKRYGGTPGRVCVPDGDGIAVVAGPDAWRGGNPAVIIERVRTADGAEHPAAKILGDSGAYLG